MAFYIGPDQISFRGGGAACKPGGGLWTDSSDARIKTVLGDYTSGLDAIAALRPVRYQYRGNDTHAEPAHVRDGEKADVEATGEPSVPIVNSPHYADAIEQRERIGLIAQEAEFVMPEMVRMSRGYIDGIAVEDIRDLDTGPAIFALINAVKELKARVEQLAQTPALDDIVARLEKLEAK